MKTVLIILELLQKTNDMKRFLVAIGLILGVSLFSWILVVINKNKSNSGYQYEDKYIANCENIQLVMTDFKNFEKEVKRQLYARRTK